MTVVVTPTLDIARRLVERHGLPEDGWIHVAAAAIAADLIDRSEDRGVRLDWLPEQRPPRSVTARVVTVERRAA